MRGRQRLRQARLTAQRQKGVEDPAHIRRRLIHPLEQPIAAKGQSPSLLQNGAWQPNSVSNAATGNPLNELLNALAQQGVSLAS